MTSTDTTNNDATHEGSAGTTDRERELSVAEAAEIKSEVEPAPIATPARGAGNMTKDELVRWLSGADITDDDTTDEITFDQAVRIFDATDEADVLRDDQVVKIKDLTGQTFTVLSVSWRKSTKSEDGAGRYAFMEVANSDGERLLTSCGATKVVLQLRKAEIEGWFPWTVQLDAVETNNNRTMLQLVAPPAPGTKGADF